MSDQRLLAGKSVLIVEDNFVAAIDIDQTLSSAGAKVVGLAATAEQALMLIADQGHQLDVAVLDINLGLGITTVPVAAELKKIGIPYLFLSGESSLPQDEACSGRTLLMKPVREAELVDALRFLIACDGT